MKFNKSKLRAILQNKWSVPLKIKGQGHKRQSKTNKQFQIKGDKKAMATNCDPNSEPIPW